MHMTFELYAVGAVAAWILYVKYHIPAEAGRKVNFLDAAIVVWFSWISVLLFLIAFVAKKKWFD